MDVKNIKIQPKLKEECGVFGGISTEKNASTIIIEGLNLLQHRGQEGCGIAYLDKSNFKVLKGKGLIRDVFKQQEDILSNVGIGHVRYSTQGDDNIANVQPFLVNYKGEEICIAHNGHIPSAKIVRKSFEDNGELLTTTSDTEVLIKKMVSDLRHISPSKWLIEDIYSSLKTNFFDGAWSIVMGLKDRVIGLRDPHGYRPLMLAIAEEGVFLASEDCAFEYLNIKQIIEIQAGQAVEIKKGSYKIYSFEKSIEQKCVFEQIYFSKPQSNIFGKNVYSTRVDLGRLTANIKPVDADMIIPIMDTGLASAIGYSQASGIEMHMGLLRNYWIGRSFIQPTNKSRTQTVKEKLSPIQSIINEKRIVLVDDSLVRGITSKELVKMVKNAGAKEVHLRITSPMLFNTCLWGVDIPTKDELITSRLKSVEEICEFLNADSLEFLPHDALYDYFGTGWCFNCFCTSKQEQLELNHNHKEEALC